MLTCSIAKESVWDVTKANIPFIGVLLATLLLITYVPVVDARAGERSSTADRWPTRSWSSATAPIATVVLNRPEKLNALTRPMWKRLGEVFARALGRRRGALHRDPRRGRPRRSRPATTSPSSPPSAPTSSRRAPTARTCAAPIEAIGRLPPSGGGADPRHLRRRRPRDRRPRRPPHLRRVEPLRRADQQARAGDGVCRDRLADRARRARRSRWRSCSRAACSTRRRRRRRASSRASCPTTRSRPKRARPPQRIADGAPLVARWHKKFARRLRDPQAAHRGRVRRGLRLLRHRGLPDRLRGVPRQAKSRSFKGR